MIFSYKYIPNHPFERLQTYIEHTVLKVWCSPVGAFTVSILQPDFKKLVEEVSVELLLNPIHRIYDICRNELTQAQRDRLREGFIANNDIEGLCLGKQSKPLTYAEITTFHPKLSEELASFFTDLYTKVPKRKAVEKQCGGLLDHFQYFIQQGSNDIGYCAFCGYEKLKSEYETQPHDLVDPLTGKIIQKPGRRDAYDHYLPKGTYPFSSVNLRNLAPACYNCNSANKLANDPIRRGRKAFYPYSTNHPSITISVILKTSDLDKLTGDQVTVDFASAGYEDEIETWKDLFGIDTRYSGMLARVKETKAWTNDFMNNWIRLRHYNPALTVKECLDDYLEPMKDEPLQDTRFLKIPFLEACVAAGVMQDWEDL